jgi:hypothetical protein
MAVDRKYGRVTLEHGSIGEDEPVVVFRAQDSLLPKVLMYYRLFCWKAGSPWRHLRLIDDTTKAVEEWQDSHRHQVRVPNSDASREWMDE